MCLKVFTAENYDVFLKKKGLSFGAGCSLRVHVLPAPNNGRLGCLPWVASLFKENQNISKEIRWLINRTFPGSHPCVPTFNLMNYFSLCSFKRIILHMPIGSETRHVRPDFRLKHSTLGISTALLSNFKIEHRHCCLSDGQTEVPNGSPKTANGRSS